MKNNRGMGYIQVIVIIVIIVFVVIKGISYIKTGINEQYIETIKNNMLLIQWKIEDYKEIKKASGEEITYIGTKISDMQDDELIKPILEENVIVSDEYDKYYVLKDENLAELSLEITNEEQSYYIVNYDNLEIIITKGCEYEKGKTLYKFSDIEKGVIEENIEEEQNTDEDKTDQESEENNEESNQTEGQNEEKESEESSEGE